MRVSIRTGPVPSLHAIDLLLTCSSTLEFVCSLQSYFLYNEYILSEVRGEYLLYGSTITCMSRLGNSVTENEFFSGKNCGTNTNECSSSPCQNGATCKDAVNGYSCACVAGYEGVHCETDTDDCKSRPCKNGGKCTDKVNGYVCTCAPGYEGKNQYWIICNS